MVPEFAHFLETNPAFRDQVDQQLGNERSPSSVPPNQVPGAQAHFPAMDLGNPRTILFQRLDEDQQKNLLSLYESHQGEVMEGARRYLGRHTLHDDFTNYPIVMNNLFSIALNTRAPEVISMLKSEVDRLSQVAEDDPEKAALIFRWTDQCNDFDQPLPYMESHFLPPTDLE